MIPDVTVHGVWVRSKRLDTFGRLAWKILDRTYYGQVEFVCVWEPDEDLGTKRPMSDYHSPEELEVRPYKPRPWLDNPPIEVRYREWAEAHRQRKEQNGDHSNV